MSLNCKAIVKSGKRHGQQCQFKAKYNGYCGNHKRLHQKKMSLEDKAHLATVTLGLITIAEKILEYAPIVFDKAHDVLNSFNISFYPEFDQFGFPKDRTEFFTKNNTTRSDIQSLMNEVRHDLDKGIISNQNIERIYNFIVISHTSDRSTINRAKSLYRDYKKNQL
ncbi:hypothetical protein P7M10_23525 [Vibrio parahaemolyticus]|uniref:DUF5763 domain-containing protein n=1 Tax=Vibrio parahaemolyticus TaxID=670 RepID=UPI00402B2FD1|nr:hypothetical protein [Vibrio parahaemolyticus]